jgi:predicted glycosyltransferase
VRILLDVLHPAHVHFFRNFYGEMEARGHELYITARDKDHSADLLRTFDLPFEQISSQRSGAFGLATELFTRTRALLSVAKAFEPDVLTGIMGPSIALAGRLQRIPAVVFYDTEFAVQTNWFVYPLAHSVVTPDSYQGAVRGTHVTYPGYHELAYLHPMRFVPDPARLARFGVSEEELYSVVRFVSWEAVHDRRERGLTADEKREVVARLEAHGRVLISAERPLPPDLARYAVRGPVGDIHHLMAFAQMVVGESATMASEAAVLGVPAVFIATTGRGYTDDQECRYKLVRHFHEDDLVAALATIDELALEGPRRFGHAAREQLLADKIDVTGFMVDYFESEFGDGG